MSPPPFTFGAAMHGARLTLPLLPSVMVFAAAFGAAAAGKGLSFVETVAMSGLVYAGASQMVSLELWREAWSLPSVIEVAAVTAVVNARMILMGAAIQPWLAPAPARRNALQCFFLTDASWLLGTRYQAGGGRDHGMLLGAGVFLWIVWVGTTKPSMTLDLPGGHTYEFRTAARDNAGNWGGWSAVKVKLPRVIGSISTGR